MKAGSPFSIAPADDHTLKALSKRRFRMDLESSSVLILSNSALNKESRTIGSNLRFGLQGT